MEILNDTLDIFTDGYDQIYMNSLSTTIINDVNTTNSTPSSFLMLNHSTTIDLLHRIILNSHSATTNLINDSNNNHYSNNNQPQPHLYNQQYDVNAEKLSNTLTWRKTCAIMFFSSVIFITIFGNTLVIVSVCTTRRLRTVTNCFVMSLAVADWMVGVFVLPPAVLLYIHGKNQ